MHNVVVDSQEPNLAVPRCHSRARDSSGVGNDAKVGVPGHCFLKHLRSGAGQSNQTCERKVKMCDRVKEIVWKSEDDVWRVKKTHSFDCVPFCKASQVF